MPALLVGGVVASGTVNVVLKSLEEGGDAITEVMLSQGSGRNIDLNVALSGEDEGIVNMDMPSEGMEQLIGVSVGATNMNNGDDYPFKLALIIETLSKPRKQKKRLFQDVE